jgi:cell pole-organizing protein PopZ
LGEAEAMSQPPGTTETSMEEILASIRRIISEDGAPPVAAAPLAEFATPSPPPVLEEVPAAPEAAAPEPAIEADAVEAAAESSSPSNPTAAAETLVLTQMLSQEGKVVALGRPDGVAEMEKTEPLGVLLLTRALPASEPRPAAVRDRLFPRIVAGVGQAVSQPAPAGVPQSAAATSQPPAQGAGLSVEDLVRQSLEPKIQEWLNANLPDIVERLVQQEIERIARKAE